MRRLQLPFRRALPLVGLDIGSSAVKVVAITLHRAGAMACVGWASTPPGSIVDGAIAQSGGVADAIRQALAAGGIRNRRVAVALPGSAVIVKRIGLPSTPNARLADTVAREAARHLPFNPEDVHLDYHLIGAGAHHADSPGDVMLVAARRETVAAYVGAIVEAGCAPAVIDAGAFALQNVFEWTVCEEPATSTEVSVDATVALLDVGASATTVNVVRAGASLLTRDVPVGGDACTEALQRELDLSFEAAERLKLGFPVDAWTPADAVPVMRGAAEAFALEVRRTLEFVKGGAGDEDTDALRGIDRIVLTGGGSRAGAFDAALRAHFGDAVRRFNPFRRLKVKSRLVGDSMGMDALRAHASTAVGLALRGLDHR